jgi:type I restriction-modification system DNA methylase subunit
MVEVVVNEDDFPHEHEFTADVVSWMNLIIEKDGILPFSSAKFDRRRKGSQKRRDLSLIGKDKRVLVTGEIKLPYQKDGATPYNASVVCDARRKAARAGADYFFTWNVNECVLWKTETPADDPSAGQYYRSWKIASVVKESHLTLPNTEATIKSWLGQFLNETGRIIRGNLHVGFKPPDERFVEALESALSLPIRLTFEELENRYTTSRGKSDLDSWMRDEQGWTLATDADGIRDILERAAKFACYALVNRLVFYEALMKRYGAQLHKLNVPDHIDKGDNLRLHLEGYFAEAKRVTGDYETVFGEDHSDIGNRIPFYSDHAVRHWRGPINQIHESDFSKLDYEVIGNIFERLISPDERHKYGQYYTRAEVVDLINSFCIRTGQESIIDPACGGGTFLVRAYARKRELAPGRNTAQMLNDLFGVDISSFACHLTTINLATRDLIEEENYPRIARADFFDVSAKGLFLSLPSHARSKGLGKIQHRNIEIQPLDAVIGNPPYVRQEGIKSDKTKSKTTREGTKEYYRTLVKKEAQAQLSGRSDLHCYFWPHAYTFLKPDGWLCLLTSSQWLDVEYGFKLQDWILSRFKIVAIFESVVEPWFVGARVVTTATILRCCSDPQERHNNYVRFVQLRKPLAEILSHDGTTAGAVQAADSFRDEILGLSENTVTSRFRSRVVPQRELLQNGVKLARFMRKSDDPVQDEDADEEDRQTPGAYYGGKWGIHLRAPDLWFELMDRLGDRFAPLGELAEIRFGVKSGKDEFFFPRDVSAQCLEKFPAFHEFRQQIGVRREDVESGEIRLVRCGEGYGEIRPIEAKYLEPEVHSLMEVKGFTVKSEDCGRMMLLVRAPKGKLKGTHVLKYIEWGESNGYHKGSTCAARVTHTREWYDLTGHRRGNLFWPMAQQYKHAVPVNEHRLIANHNLFDIITHESSPDLIGGILNSSFVVLSKFLYGRPVGNEGNLKTEVIDATMMPVPDLRGAQPATLQKVGAAFRTLKERQAMQFLSERRMRRMAFTKTGRDAELDGISDLSELDLDDRRNLDDAVLEMLGVKTHRERGEIINRLYSYLREFFEGVRQKEEEAIVNKNKSKRKAALSPPEIASQIFAEIKDSHGSLLRSYRDFVDVSRPYSTFDLPAAGVAEIHEDIFAPDGSVRFMKGRKQIALLPTKTREQAALVAAISTLGIRGLTRVPLAPLDCIDLKKRYETFVEGRAQRLRSLISDRTGDPDLQDRIFATLNDLIDHETNTRVWAGG